MVTPVPKCLFISPIAPDPNGNGLAQRAFMFWRALHRVFQTDVLLVPIAQAKPQLARHDEAATKPAFETIDGDFAPSTHFDLIRRIEDPKQRCAAFAAYGLPSLCANLTDDLARLCAATLRGQNYLHVHAMRSYCAPFVRSLVRQLDDKGQTNPTLTLDLDEDDARFNTDLARHFEARGETENAKWTACEARAFKTLIAANVASFDRVFASSDKEAELLSRDTGTGFETVVNSVFVPTAPKSDQNGEELLFVGSLNYLPNADGLEWFIQNVWPRVQSFTNANITIVGQSPSKHLRKLAQAPGMNLLSDVADLRPLYERAAIAVVPLRLGAGTRIKILESAALGVPVVTTAIGAEGLEFADGEHCWIANSPTAFAKSICEALAQPAERMRRANNAWQFVNRLHNINTAVDRLSGIFTQFR